MKSFYLFSLLFISTNIYAQSAADVKKHQEMMDIIMQQPKTQIKTITNFHLSVRIYEKKSVETKSKAEW